MYAVGAADVRRMVVVDQIIPDMDYEDVAD